MSPGKGLPPHPPRPRNFLLGRGREILRHFPTEKVVDKWAWLLVFGHFLLLLSIGPLPLYTSSSAPHRWPEAKLRPETGAASVSWLKKDSCRLYKPQRIVAASPRVSSTPGPRERETDIYRFRYCLLSLLLHFFFLSFQAKIFQFFYKIFLFLPLSRL